jgi:molybdopterin molybdotransferase
MEIEIQLITTPIAEHQLPPANSLAGAWVEFRGRVRGEENGAAIAALEYEAYPTMAEREIRRLLQVIAHQYPCLAARVIHRTGIVPVGETAVYVGIAGRHRGEAFDLLSAFMNRLKQDVPIWKRRAHATLPGLPMTTPAPKPVGGKPSAIWGLDATRMEILNRSKPLPAMRVPLADAVGHVLRENVLAIDDSPDCDRTTRDGFAIRADDVSETFDIVGTRHAADWQPQTLRPGEAIRMATGAPLPDKNLRVLMQENVKRTGDTLQIVRPETSANVRRRGEEWHPGQPLLAAGAVLRSGNLALLAAAGCAHPLVSPRLRVLHLTTGDEIVTPSQIPAPGQIRDSNSTLISAWLQHFPCELTHYHLPENLATAQEQLIVAFGAKESLETFDLLLVSGGAGAGDLDFTKPLLEWLGYHIVFQRLNLRPGAPLIFGTQSRQLAFGLPGNPVSHFVCAHLFVAPAIAWLTGAEPAAFLPGTLAEPLTETPHPRETLWPARLDRQSGRNQLTPLRWQSSGDIAVLAQTNALIRIPAGSHPLAAGSLVTFLPADF